MTAPARSEITWTEKLDIPPSEIRPVPEGRKNLRAGQLMLYPNGRALDDAIRAIPLGTFRTLKELRAELAETHGADITCPVTAGIVLRTVAEAAHEAISHGTPLEAIAPVWRVVDPKSPLLKKVTFDPAFILEQRFQESRPHESVIDRSR